MIYTMLSCGDCGSHKIVHVGNRAKKAPIVECQDCWRESTLTGVTVKTIGTRWGLTDQLNAAELAEIKNEC